MDGVDPGFAVAGSAELTGFPAAGSGAGWGWRGEGWSSTITFHELTLSTSECGPICVPPLTDLIHVASFLREAWRGLRSLPEVGLPWDKGQMFLPNSNELDSDNSYHSDLNKI